LGVFYSEEQHLVVPLAAELFLYYAFFSNKIKKIWWLTRRSTLRFCPLDFFVPEKRFLRRLVVTLVFRCLIPSVKETNRKRWVDHEVNIAEKTNRKRWVDQEVNIAEKTNRKRWVDQEVNIAILPFGLFFPEERHLVVPLAAELFLYYAFFQ